MADSKPPPLAVKGLTLNRPGFLQIRMAGGGGVISV